ncbi:hypothetical protein AB0H29_31985 [Streptomyces thermolilacinus]
MRRCAIATGGEHLGAGTRVSLAATTEAGAPTAYTQVRQGSVLVRFAATSGGGEPRTPLPVVVQQVMKLRAATDQDRTAEGEEEAPSCGDVWPWCWPSGYSGSCSPRR